MNAAPAWLSYVSPAIALLALAISLATYRRAGPRVKVRLNIETMTPQEADIRVIVNNAGLAPVQVVSMRFAARLIGTVEPMAPIELKNDDRYEGSALPFTLNGGHQAEWAFDVHAAQKRQFAARPLKVPTFRLSSGVAGLLAVLMPGAMLWNGFAVVVGLGNGIQVESNLRAKAMFKLALDNYKLERAREKSERD